MYTCTKYLNFHVLQRRASSMTWLITSHFLLLFFRLFDVSLVLMRISGSRGPFLIMGYLIASLIVISVNREGGKLSRAVRAYLRKENCYFLSLFPGQKYGSPLQKCQTLFTQCCCCLQMSPRILTWGLLYSNAHVYGKMNYRRKKKCAMLLLFFCGCKSSPLLRPRF